MRRNWPLGCLCVAMFAGCALAGPRPLDGKSKIDDVLDALQTSGENLKSFSADLKVTETDLNLGGDKIHSGHVWCQINPDDTVLNVILDKKMLGTRSFPDKIQYMLQKGLLINRTFATKAETQSRVSPPDQKVNLFQLGKGPFPLPIGQPKAEVHQQFDVTRVDPAADDPATPTIHLNLVPKSATDLAKQFQSIEVWVDLKSNMPSRIQTKSDDQIKVTDLGNLAVNVPIAKADLELPPLPKDWTSLEVGK